MSSSNRINWLITDQNVTVNYNGQTHIVPRADGLADRLIAAIKAEKWVDVPNLVSAAKRIEKFSEGAFTVQDGDILVNGVRAPAALGQKILRFSNDGLPYKPLVRFAEKLQQNPSYRAVNELFQFLEKNDHPITENGNFIAYKRVRHDFKDIHSGTFDNSPGTTVEMSRNAVNEDPTQTCSAGLHVANWNYAHTQFASHDPLTDVMLEVEVSPSDVVAVPIDYDQSKMRVCRYKVLGVIDKAHSSDVALRITEPSYNPSEEDGCSGKGCCGAKDGCCNMCGDEDCFGECEDEPCIDCGEAGCCGSCEEDDCCDRCGEALDTCCPNPLCCNCEAEDEEDDAYPFEDELR